MPQSRPSISAALKRELLEEAGYGCAIPGCGVTMPLDRAHLLDWAKTRDDRFGNQIMLCKNHHGLHGKTITTQDLRVIKAKLAFRQGRYGKHALSLLRMHAVLRIPRIDLYQSNENLRVTVDPLARDGYYQLRKREFDSRQGCIVERWELTQNGRFFTWAWRESGDDLVMPVESKMCRHVA
ncbi:hypothetical protein [Streptomyces coerulescens]|uniref:HNH nuclease domain-containing protein n=1 Tax=Streptomyces coerulescens TaxID=29304 RepID=A0ABW0CGD2_STRCD